MIFMRGSNRTGTPLTTWAAGCLLLVAGSLAGAETVTTINGVDIDSSVVDFYIQSRTQRPATQATAEQREALTKELTDIYLLATGKAAAKFRQDPRIQAQIELQSRSIVAQAVASEVIAGLPITEDEILAEYDVQVTQAPSEQFKARHILVETQGEANEIIAALDEGGDFQDLAKERSTGPSGPSGGDLGWFAPNQMVKPFADAVATMENGQYSSEPVQTQFGWHVILREDSRETEAPTLDSVRNQIRQSIQQRKFQEYLEGLRAESQG